MSDADILQIDQEYVGEREKLLRVYRQTIAETDTGYHDQAAGIILNDLTTSQRILNQRDKELFSSGGEANRREAERIYAPLKSLGKSKLTAAIDAMAPNLSKGTEKALRTMAGIETPQGKQEVHSYVSAWHPDQGIYGIREEDRDNIGRVCYFLSPLGEQGRGVLHQNLERRLGDLLGGDASLLSPVEGGKIEVDVNQMMAQNLLCYSILLEENEGARLAEYLSHEFSRTRGQPEGFKEAGLKHRVISTRFSFADHFVERYDPGNSTAPRRNGQSKMTVEATTLSPEEIRQKLSERNGNPVSMKEVMSLLGYSSWPGVYVQFKGVIIKERGESLIPKEEILKFLETHERRNSRWRKIPSQ